MNLLADLADWNLAAFALGYFAVLNLAREAGLARGLGVHRRGEKDEGVGLVVGSILALLVFVLALTLSFATSRQADRRQGALAEANAISAAWLQAGALGDSRSDEIAALIEDYARLRIGDITAGRGSDSIAKIDASNRAIQDEIWNRVAALVQDPHGPATVTLMTSVNTLFGATTAEKYALAAGMPGQLMWLLFAMTMTGMAGLGYQLGTLGTPRRTLTIPLSLLWTILVVEILDLGTARIGTFRTDTLAYDLVISGFDDAAAAP